VVTEPQSAAQSPDMAIPFGIKFTGYARYAHFQAADQKYVAVDGSYNGASAIGRLGNEGNGGEFQLSKPSRRKRRHLGHQRDDRPLGRRS
jgi:maltoporin